MNFILCLPTFVNPIAKTVFFENQQWCTGKGTELGLRNSTFELQILPSLALWHWTNHALYPNALICEDLLWERTTFSSLSEPSEHSTWPEVQRPILRRLLMCLLFNFHKDSAILCFFTCSWKKVKREKGRRKRKDKKDAEDWKAWAFYVNAT